MILQISGNVTVPVAKLHAESEFEKYSIIQDRLFVSDFDRLVSDVDKDSR
ncbi:protein of unknown function [Maridesulfovibrio hydrothermalis AM13 = DSM 14728]|uniref:Uncharacterized protein n=1 Tax=Maridesulfovibrio hydrothermalis AM13 = DSM 14728 TaxID=1121451 RepID=L0RDS4_9BACT|nr:protein of unknown function [Maridesulfovibrio hydrothermalis AM13 = DSM 14728]